MTVDQIAGNKLLQSASREDRSESGFPQYVRNFVSLLSLNFDIASLDGASAAACFLHFFGTLRRTAKRFREHEKQETPTMR